MKIRKLRRKRGQSRNLGSDRVIAAAVVVMVTMVCLLIGFSSPSIEFSLPGLLAGWVYIGLVISVATALLVWVIRIREERKG
jgi:cyanate permease